MEKKALIQKFLANQANAEEAEEAMQYLQDHPELLDSYLPEADWETTQPAPIPEHIDTAMREMVDRSTRPFRLYRILKPLTAAAAIMMLFIGVYRWMSSIKVSASLETTISQASEPKRSFDTIFNTGSGQRTIRLRDGSSVQLYGHSNLVIPADMSNSRELVLEGKAVFQVAKNPALPFVVKSGAISTTALGTIFMVDATMKESAIHVALYEGKIVVKPLNLRLNMPDTYLYPGQECNVNMVTGAVELFQPKKYAQGASPVPVLKTYNADPDDLSLSFEKVPLSYTFNRLERRFGKLIRFDSSAVNTQLFTGNFEEEDQLFQILSVIGTMNGLVVEEQNGAYYMARKGALAPPIPPSTESTLIAGLLPSPEAFTVPGPELPAIEVKKEIAEPLRVTQTPEGIHYQQASLASVFDLLESRHGIRIQYDKNAIGELYFTGTMPDDHSYINMLQVICRMNKLKLQKIKRGHYLVESSH